MVPGVISDRVSCLGDSPHDVRSLADITADQEERRFHLVASQHVQQVLGVRIIRAVVIGERKLLVPGGNPTKLRP